MQALDSGKADKETVTVCLYRSPPTSPPLTVKFLYSPQCSGDTVKLLVAVKQQCMQTSLAQVWMCPRQPAGVKAIKVRLSDKTSCLELIILFRSRKRTQNVIPRHVWRQFHEHPLVLHNAVLGIVLKSDHVGKVDLNAVLVAQTDESRVIFRMVMCLVHLQKRSAIKTLGSQKDVRTTRTTQMLYQPRLFEHLRVALNKKRQIEFLINHGLQELRGLGVFVEIVGGKNNASHTRGFSPLQALDGDPDWLAAYDLSAILITEQNVQAYGHPRTG